jgi:hypothetical protein
VIPLRLLWLLPYSFQFRFVCCNSLRITMITTSWFFDSTLFCCNSLRITMITTFTIKVCNTLLWFPYTMITLIAIKIDYCCDSLTDYYDYYLVWPFKIVCVVIPYGLLLPFIGQCNSLSRVVIPLRLLWLLPKILGCKERLVVIPLVTMITTQVFNQICKVVIPLRITMITTKLAYSCYNMVVICITMITTQQNNWNLIVVIPLRITMITTAYIW